MTASLDTAVAEVVGTLDAISDPIERYQEVQEAETKLDAALKGVRQRIALELKKRMTWREVGQIMGGVTAQLAEQISRGV